MSLDKNFINALLLKELNVIAAPREKPPQGSVGLKYVKPQVGPLRWYDKEMRCASRGCSSPTYFRLNDIPRCSTHALYMMNEELVLADGNSGDSNSSD